MADETWVAKVDWNADGDWSDAYEDVSADLVSLEYGAGRNKATDEFAAGTCTLVLENAAGTYSRYNSSSPLYGMLLPGRELILQAVHGSTYDCFRGTLVDMSEAVSVEGIPTVSLTFADAFERLRLGLTNTALQQGKRIDELITAVLDNISWPAGRRTLDTALETLTVFTNHNRVPLNALQLAAKQELGGLLFIGPGGNVTFQNRENRTLQPHYATVSDMRALSLAFRQDDLIDSVRAEYARFTVEASLSAVFSLSTPRWLNPGTGTFDFELNASGVLGAQGYVTPLVATTDFTANSQLDGSGTDKTAQVGLSITASDSGGGTITYTNLDSSPVALRTCQVRAFALKAGGETNVAKVAAPVPIVTGQKLSETFEFNDNGNTVGGWASWMAGTLSVDQPRPVIDLEGHTDAEIDMLLGAGISKRILLQNTTGLYPSQLNGYFYIEAYRVRKAIGSNMEATWTLFSEDQAMGNFFRISGDTPGGANENSQIVADAATSGDRIGF